MTAALFPDEQEMHRTAHIDSTGVYRYSLGRDWSDEPRMTFIMLNPSKANAIEDDPTIGRCMSFARREGAGGINVVNLFALRATNPAALQQHSDPVGPENNKAILAALHRSEWIVAAWGAHKFATERATMVRNQLRADRRILLCLGTTKDGHPRHPLYVKADQPLVSYR